jgi:hypothetical protein
MTEHDARDLERRLHEALQRVPSARAPEGLRPRVMAAVRARSARPWYQPAWGAWPSAAQAVVVVAGLAFIGAGVWWAPALGAWARAPIGALWQLVPGGVDVTLPAELQRVVDVVAAARVVWRTVLGPVLFYAAAFSVVVGGMFAACALLVTRLTLGRAVA